MKNRYKIILYTPQELNHSSNVQTGFFELEKQDVLEVEIKIDCSSHKGKFIVSDKNEIIETYQASPKTSFYKLIDNQTQKHISFAIDLYDFANHFSKEALDTCDYIFKRSYESKYVNRLSEKHRTKINKFGLTFGVHSHYKRDSIKFYLGLILSNLNVNLKFDRLVFSRLIKTTKKQIAHWNFVKTTRGFERFQSYNLPKKDIILFQTRCFWSESDQDVLCIHQQRYDIIMFLRNMFPNRFMGGFIPSEMASKNYADALTNVPSEPEKYLDVLKEAKVVIYTRGLANSPAWKMAEYLSQGKIIIAEPLTTELPIPLQHGKELLFFNSNQELKDNIDLVLSDKNLADSLSQNARLYYENHINPVKNIERIISKMVD